MKRAGHAVTVVSRGTTEEGRPGWAARCSCGAITFGGFASRAAARAALDHDDDNHEEER